MAVSYYEDGVKTPAIKKRIISNWIKEVAATYGKKKKKTRRYSKLIVNIYSMITILILSLSIIRKEIGYREIYL